jgi:hypothetical protein
VIRTIALMFLIVTITPKILNFGLVVNYYTNMLEYIEACKNIDKPDLQCNGKCHLKEMMFSVPESIKEDIPVEPQIKIVNEVVLFLNDLLERFTLNSEKTSKALIQYQYYIIENEDFEIFIPPKI